MFSYDVVYDLVYGFICVAFVSICVFLFDLRLVYSCVCVLRFALVLVFVRVCMF